MNKIFKKSLFIFRRDLRLHDNTALINALNSSESVICVYLLDENIFESNSVYSSLDFSIKPVDLYKRMQRRPHLLFFLKKSLIDLQRQFSNLDKLDYTSNNVSKDEAGISYSQLNNALTKDSSLSFLYGDPPTLIDEVLQHDNEIEAVFINKDYSPYSRRRDKLINKTCQKNNINLFTSADLLLNEPEEILNSAKKPFKIFTHYYNESIKKTVKEEFPIPLTELRKITDRIANNKSFTGKLKNLVLTDLDTFFEGLGYNETDGDRIAFHGGKKGYQIEVTDLAERLAGYRGDKDVPEKGATSHLSTYIKFGICSIREIYHALQSLLGDSKQCMSIHRQLYWRDFFIYIGFHFPFVFGRSFKDKYSENGNSSPIKWKNNPFDFGSWCRGNTGFPIVDAGMRELNETGYMHNRTRLITASFLVKDLHIDWRYGERYFALKLIDYDPCVNNGNWQWVASTGCDSMPYFRIFNPWLQQKKFDPGCVYIRRWIPEVRKFSNKDIHEWYKQPNRENDIYNYGLDDFSKERNRETSIYPRPIVDHMEEMRLAKQLYGI